MGLTDVGVWQHTITNYYHIINFPQILCFCGWFVLALISVFKGVGVWQRNGASGASHGGTGGQGACDNYLTCKLRRNHAYGNLYEPKMFGSGGAGTKGGSGVYEQVFFHRLKVYCKRCVWKSFFHHKKV